MFPGLDLYDTYPAQHLIATGQHLNYLDHDVSDVSDMCACLQLTPKRECDSLPTTIANVSNLRKEMRCLHENRNTFTTNRAWQQSDETNRETLVSRENEIGDTSTKTVAKRE